MNGDQATLPCPLCGKTATLLSTKTRQYGDCLHCGFISLLPRCRPSLESEKARYELHRNSRSDSGYVHYLDDFVSTISTFLIQGASILDFGSGPEPVLALLLRDCGFWVSTYDPIYSLTDPEKSAPFDCVVVHEVAEHFAEPLKEFRIMAKLVKRDGMIAIRTRLAPDNPNDFKHWWYKEDLCHIAFYRKKTLKTIAAIIGAKNYRVMEKDILLFFIA
jgi:SAM-dependent methyltransferase